MVDQQTPTPGEGVLGIDLFNLAARRTFRVAQLLAGDQFCFWRATGLANSDDSTLDGHHELSGVMQDVELRAHNRDRSITDAHNKGSPGVMRHVEGGLTLNKGNRSLITVHPHRDFCLPVQNDARAIVEGHSLELTPAAPVDLGMILQPRDDEEQGRGRNGRGCAKRL